MDASSGLESNAGDNRLTVVDNGLATGDNGSAIDNDKSTAGIGKRADVYDKSDAKAGNQTDARPGIREDAGANSLDSGSSNGPDIDLIMDNAG